MAVQLGHLKLVHLLQIGTQSQVILTDKNWLHVLIVVLVKFIHLLMAVQLGLQRVHLLHFGTQSQVILTDKSWLHVLMVVKFIHQQMAVQLGL